jgi:hypothetical protein
MMRFVQSYARTHAYAYSHTPMRTYKSGPRFAQACPLDCTRPAGRFAASFPGRDLYHPLAMHPLGPAVRAGVVGADEALILWTLDSGLALDLAPTHLHGIECPPMPFTCRNRAVPAAPSEPPHTSDPEIFLIFDGNRTGPGGRLATVHSVRAQRSRAETCTAARSLASAATCSHPS